MKTKQSSSTNSIFSAAVATISVLVFPALFDWPWTRSDFIVMGVIVFVFSLALDLVFKKAGKYKVAGGIAIVLLFVWLWAELAVGLFTNWGS